MSRIITLLGNGWFQKDQQNYSKPAANPTANSHTYLRGEKGEEEKGKNPRGGWLPRNCASPQPSWMCSMYPRCQHCWSQQSFPSCHTFDFPLIFHVRRAQLLFLQHKHSMGTIPKLFTRQKCFRGLCWPPLCYIASKTAACLCCKAARLNSLMFTKCFKTTEQKSVGFKQQNKVDY